MTATMTRSERERVSAADANPGGKESTATDIRRIKSPEELEVERLLEESEERKQRIADLELELETLKQELARFQAEIDCKLGPLYTELDRLNVRREQYQTRIERLRRLGRQANPQVIEEQLAAEFQKRWSEIRDNEERVRNAQAPLPHPSLSHEEEEELKGLYRRLAKRFHPDLAETEAERARNEQIMMEINRAYGEKDLERLRRTEATKYPEPEQITESIGEKLVRLIRRRHILDQVIAGLEAQIRQLQASESYKLMQQVKEGTRGGKDLISVWESELKAEIAKAESDLESVIGQFKDLVVEIFWGPLD